MSISYQNNSEDYSNFNEVDEDDEFGGAKLTPALIFGKKYAVKNSLLEDDEDDEYGGGKLSPEKIFRKKYANTQTVEVPQETSETTEEEEKVRPPLFTSQYKIFCGQIANNQWFVDRDEDMTDTVTNPYKSITIPLVIDTEFTEKENKKEYKQGSRMGLTTQIGGIGSDTPKIIFAHTDRVNAGRLMGNEKPFPLIETDFHPVDYLKEIGTEVEICEGTESELRDLPKCFIVLYGHFLTAEINMIASGSVKERLKDLQRSQGEEQILSGRRAFAQTAIGENKVDWASLKHIITIEGQQYELCLKLVDTGAIHGVASYKDFCESSGWKLLYKDNFNSDEKSRMLQMCIERYKDFEDYALGDLDVYEALNSFYEQWKIVYEKMGLEPYYQPPKLTIGGTVKDLFEAALAKKLGVAPLDEDGKSVWRKALSLIVDEFIKPTSANDLRQFTTHTRALLAKVEGGRCRNNRPTDIFAKRKIKGVYDAGLICDLDIAGCYGEGQRNQDYFIGIPEIFDYKAGKNNQYITLREWLKSYDVDVEKLVKTVNEKDRQEWKNPENWGELISGGWYGRITSSEKLKYSQDYFASWFTETADRTDLLAKSIRAMKSDTEMVSSDWVDFDEECGSLKIFNHEIHNGVLTHDGLQWILAVASPRQRNELLDKIQVLSSAVYPRSQKISAESPKEELELLQEKHQTWEGKNTTQRIKSKGRSQIIMNFDECHTWFAINLGDLIVTDLLVQRKIAQKVHGKKSPLDQLFKLCVNTLYGDMVSKFFITSNPVVGNNITARARSLAWYMEKGLYGWQSITDGCAFELNGVLYHGRDIINGECVNLHRKKSKLDQRMIKKAPLGNSIEILGEWIQYTNKSEVKYALKLVVDENEMSPIISDDGENVKVPALEWIDKIAMEHLQELFPVVDVLHNETTSIKIGDDLEVSYRPRKGQFSFESKDVYHSGGFQGSANYILSNPSGDVIKTRGYETKREHTAIENLVEVEGDEVTFLKSDRYGKKDSPAKDFMNQISKNPENIKRQIPAIKKGILKIADYKNISSKYDEIGIEPGDSILKSFLMQEFSLSQFTFESFEQYMNWKKIITHLKETDKQSLEGYFLNEDGSLDFVRMCTWVDEKIAEGVDKPFDLLCDTNRNDRRTEKRAKNPKQGKQQPKIMSLSHPHLDIFNKLKEQINLADEIKE